jgi:hypothetical protein
MPEGLAGKRLLCHSAAGELPMNAVEPIADAATGALIAGAVEGRTGLDPSGHTAERACLNCRTPLIGSFCHACGQKGHVHRTLGAFGHDLLHGVFHFEGKIWRTLPLLAWRPGELTRHYIDGQRARFVSPIALFLFCVFLMFAVLGWTRALDVPTGNIAAGLDNSAKVQREAVTKLQAEQAEAARQGRPTAAIEAKLRDAREDLQVTEALQARGEIIDRRTPDQTANVASWLRGPLEKLAKNPDLVFFKLKTNAYKFSWMLIPLSVPFMWLLFPFDRRFGLYDHTVFVTYSLSFMTLLAIAAALLVQAGLSTLASLLTFVPPLHWYRQLKGAYRLSRGAALWRTAMLLFFTTITTSLFASILLALGVFD